MTPFEVDWACAVDAVVTVGSMFESLCTKNALIESLIMGTGKHRQSVFKQERLVQTVGLDLLILVLVFA